MDAESHMPRPGDVGEELLFECGLRIWGIRPEMLRRHQALKNMPVKRAEDNRGLKSSLDFMGQTDPLLLTKDLAVVDGWARVLWKVSSNKMLASAGVVNRDYFLIWFRYFDFSQFSEDKNEAIRQVFWWRHLGTARLAGFDSYSDFRKAYE